eukprot:2161095-Rhodomonas_salina.1
MGRLTPYKPAIIPEVIRMCSNIGHCIRVIKCTSLVTNRRHMTWPVNLRRRIRERLPTALHITTNQGHQSQQQTPVPKLYLGPEARGGSPPAAQCSSLSFFTLSGCAESQRSSTMADACGGKSTACPLLLCSSVAVASCLFLVL